MPPPRTAMRFIFYVLSFQSKNIPEQAALAAHLADADAHGTRGFERDVFAFTVVTYHVYRCEQFFWFEGRKPRRRCGAPPVRSSRNRAKCGRGCVSRASRSTVITCQQAIGSRVTMAPRLWSRRPGGRIGAHGGRLPHRHSVRGPCGRSSRRRCCGCGRVVLRGVRPPYRS